MNATSASLQITPTVAIQSVNLDTASNGGFTAKMPTPASCVDAQVVIPRDVTLVGGSNWGTTPGQVSILSGVKIEDPANPGTYLAGPCTVTFPKTNGGRFPYQLDKTEGVWSTWTS